MQHARFKPMFSFQSHLGKLYRHRSLPIEKSIANNICNGMIFAGVGIGKVKIYT